MATTFTYDNTALSTELNRIRLEIGDTNSNEPLLYDGEITQIQAEYTTFNKRCCACCKAIMAKFAREVDYNIAGYSEKAGSIYDRYEKLAKHFAQLGAASYPYSSSLVQDDKDAYQDDSDLVQPKVKRGMHDNT